jgi:hypothetical protein
VIREVNNFTGPRPDYAVKFVQLLLHIQVPEEDRKESTPDQSYRVGEEVNSCEDQKVSFAVLEVVVEW